MDSLTCIIDPCSLIACNGDVQGAPLVFSAYEALPDTFVSFAGSASSFDGLNKKPALICSAQGRCTISENYNLEAISRSRFVLSGQAWLIKDYDKRTYTRDSVQNRLGIGFDSQGQLILMAGKMLRTELVEGFYGLGCSDAIELITKDAFYDYRKGGRRMGTQPQTILAVKSVKELKRPIIVLDAGHGGTDSGAVGNNLVEKNINLKGTLWTHQYLTDNYECTVLLTRDKDKTVELLDRSKMANGIGADFFLSSHINAGCDGGVGGFESFTQIGGMAKSRSIREVIHKEIMDYLDTYKVRDRGMKEGNLSVTRETKMPAVLVEMLFLDSPENVKLLKDDNIMKGAYYAQARGIAKALKLPAKKAVPTPVVNNTLYTVQVGSSYVKSTAETLLEKVKTSGFEDAIIVETKK